MPEVLEGTELKALLPQFPDLINLIHQGLDVNFHVLFDAFVSTCDHFVVQFFADLEIIKEIEVGSNFVEIVVDEFVGK